jgi:hypothetical protein
MFIQTEQTPNPATLKFLPGQRVMEKGTADFTDPQSAERSPLATRLFQIEGVTGVFFGSDFVTVSKRDDKEWHVLKPAILGAIMEHFMSDEPLVYPDAAGGEEVAVGGEEEDEIVAQIKELLDTRVRPAVAQDRHRVPRLRERGRVPSHDGGVFGLPELDRHAEGGHRKPATPLHPRGRRGSVGELGEALPAPGPSTHPAP